MTQSLYKRRVAEGKCGTCGEPNTDNRGKSTCLSCLQIAKERAAARRADAAADGLCISCKKVKPRKGSSRCPACLEVNRADAARRAAARKEAGLCLCGAEPKEGCVLCQNCIDKRSEVTSEHYRRRKEAGLCYHCDKPPEEGYVLCEYHREQNADYRLQLKIDALNAYGGPQCAGKDCNCIDADVLEIDHVDGGGCKHRRLVTSGRGGHPFYQWLKREGYPPGFRVLCPTCNKKAHILAQRTV
jgi:hypothetical protein